MQPFTDYTQEQEELIESSLSRIHSRIMEHSTGALSAFRDEFTRSENRKRNKEMLAWLHQRGYSVTHVKGAFIEQFNMPNAVEVGEESWFVANTKVDGDDGGKLERDLIKIGRHFDQDSILSIESGGKKAELIGTSQREDAFPSYGERVNVGGLKMGDADGPFFSRVRGRKFAFEARDMNQPGSIGGKQAMSIIAKRIDEDMEDE